MRRIIVALTLSLTLAACSPYDPPAAADPATTTTTTVAPACDQACIYRYAHAVETARIHRVYAYAAAVERARVARIYAFAAAIERARLARLAPTGYGVVQGIRVCNGTTLPTCKIVDSESGFDPNARNPRSTAWGLYQFLRGTWRATCPEYPHGSATVAQQVECARRLWAGGRGSYHWRLTR